MSEFIPLVAGAGPVASLLIGIIIAFKMTEAARRDAVERYKLTAEEADKRYDDASARLTTVEGSLDEIRLAFGECQRKLGQALAEVEMSKIREKRLADRIGHLEDLVNNKEQS